MTDREYLNDGIRRVQAGDVKGSHAAGVFGRCAADFETAIRAWFTVLLAECDLGYDKELRAHCKDVELHKATLGNLIAGIRRVGELKKGALETRVGSSDVTTLLHTLESVNREWIRVKHKGEELSDLLVLAQMKSMARVLDSLSIEPRRRDSIR